jgi:hypothetical protein
VDWCSLVPLLVLALLAASCWLLMRRKDRMNTLDKFDIRWRQLGNPYLSSGPGDAPKLALVPLPSFLRAIVMAL